MIRDWLRQELAKKHPGTSFEVLIPPDSKLGDYSVNLAFVMAKRDGISPMQAGEKIAEQFKDSEYFERVAVVPPGFVNFFLKKEYLQNNFNKIEVPSIGQGKKVIVEYSQPNIAKKMHVGHLRTTILGDSLASIYKEAGYDVVRWNYLGDWGTQFGKLIAAYKMWGKKGEVEKNPIQTLVDLYVRFHKEMESNPDLESRGREEFKKLETGDSENHELWQWFREESLKEFDRMYRLLGVKFDIDIGESFFEPAMKPLIKELADKGIAVESEGSLIVKLDEYSLPPALVRKSDGTSLYLTRDIANLRYRIENFHPAKIIYVVGNEQTLHFQQLFVVAKMLGIKDIELIHAKYGLVLAEEGKKFATREGRAVFLDDVIAKAVELARSIVEAKNKKLSNKEEVAKTVAIGALKYAVLHEGRTSDIKFDWQKMLDFSGDSGPYLQYTYARLKSIDRKIGFFSRLLVQPDVGLLDHELELGLMKHLLNFPDAIVACVTNNSVNALALYLYELANYASRYYEEVRILDDKNRSRRAARLLLIDNVAETLKRGLKLLGIEVLEQI